MKGMGAKRRFLFYTELAKLTEAGFGFREAMAVMEGSRPGGAEKRVLGEVGRGLNEGLSIAGSFGAGEVSRMERGIVEAGERSGKLAPAFQHLADYFELLAGARADALKALIYPLILLHLGMLLAVIPPDVMSGGLSAPNLLARLLVVLLGTYGLIGGLGLLVAWLLSLAPESAAVDRLINAVPVVGGARRNLAMARFTKVYHAALVAGLPMAETAGMAAEASNSGSIRAAAKSLQSAVEAGQPMGPAFLSEKVFPRPFAKSYATAEEAGMLDKDLARWATVFQTNAASAVRMMALVLPKLGYVLVVAFVVWRLVGFYSGYYGSMEKIGL